MQEQTNVYVHKCINITSLSVQFGQPLESDVLRSGNSAIAVRPQ